MGVNNVDVLVNIVGVAVGVGVCGVGVFKDFVNVIVGVTVGVSVCCVGVPKDGVAVNGVGE